MIFLAFRTTSARSTMSTKTPASIVVANTRWLGLVCRMTWVSCAKRPASLRRIRASLTWDGGSFGSSGTDIIRHDAVARIWGRPLRHRMLVPCDQALSKRGRDLTGSAPLPRLPTARAMHHYRGYRHLADGSIPTQGPWPAGSGVPFSNPQKV